MMKTLFLSFFLLLATSTFLFAQPERIGAGLAFANVLDFNGGETSNPGLFLKTWIALDQKSKLHVVPSFTVFNRYKFDPGQYVLKVFTFHGDLDAQYVVFTEKNIKVIGFAGGNFTYLTSTFEPYFVGTPVTLSDAKDWAVGGNLGAALELRMSSHWDFIVSGKYKISKYPQFVISVSGAYFFRDRSRSYRR
jgi:hypothetical protein